MWHSIRNIVCACVFMSTCVGGDWQFQQMCSMHWQHDIYFACSIWHVWMLPCIWCPSHQDIILSWCEVIARDVHPRWDHSLLSFLHQYQNVFLTNGKNSKTDTQISFQFSFFFFLFSILWLTASANTKGTFFSCYITKTWTVYLKECGGHMDCWVVGWLLLLSINLSC